MLRTVQELILNKISQVVRFGQIFRYKPDVENSGLIEPTVPSDSILIATDCDKYYKPAVEIPKLQLRVEKLEYGLNFHDKLEARWQVTGSPDFLNYSPEIWLFRYSKARRKKLNAGTENEIKVRKEARWVHSNDKEWESKYGNGTPYSGHSFSDSLEIITRNTEYPLTTGGKWESVNFNPAEWFLISKEFILYKQGELIARLRAVVRPEGERLMQQPYDWQALAINDGLPQWLIDQVTDVEEFEWYPPAQQSPFKNGITSKEFPLRTFQSFALAIVINNPVGSGKLIGELTKFTVRPNYQQRPILFNDDEPPIQSQEGYAKRLTIKLT